MKQITDAVLYLLSEGIRTRIKFIIDTNAINVPTRQILTAGKNCIP